MTRPEIDQLNMLRARGYGPTRISCELGISINTVASYIRRHPDLPGMSVCEECGSLFESIAGRKPKRFCSSACKSRWWNKHRTEGKRNLNTISCAYCGKEFMAYESDKRKYCSQDCYHNARRAANH